MPKIKHDSNGDLVDDDNRPLKVTESVFSESLWLKLQSKGTGDKEKKTKDKLKVRKDKRTKKVKKKAKK